MHEHKGCLNTNQSNSSRVGREKHVTHCSSAHRRQLLSEKMSQRLKQKTDAKCDTHSSITSVVSIIEPGGTKVALKTAE